MKLCTSLSNGLSSSAEVIPVVEPASLFDQDLDRTSNIKQRGLTLAVQSILVTEMKKSASAGLA